MVLSVLPVCQGGQNAQCHKSISIPDGIKSAPVNDNIELPDGVSCCPYFATKYEGHKRRLSGGAKHPIDLHTQKPFMLWRDCDSGCMFATRFASTGMGTVESRRLRQTHLVKLGVNKGPPGKVQAESPTKRGDKKP